MKRAIAMNLRPDQIIEAEHRALTLDRKGSRAPSGFALENPDVKVGRA
jgi:hypothetical protein